MSWTLAKRTLVVVAGTICVAFVLGLHAQVQTTTSTKAGTPEKQVQVESAQVVYVSGNDLVVKMADGTIRHISNVPESARVDVDGKELGIHDLKPGMTLHRTITTTTTPKVITTVKTVKGTVWYVKPPSTVILTLEDGKNQQFKIPNGQKFMVNGQETDAWGLKKGMEVNATQVVEEPVTSVSVHKQLTGELPPPPPTPAAAPILVLVETVAVPTPAPAAPVEEAAQKELPKTGSELPLLALLGCFSLVGAASTRLLRRCVS